MIRETHKKNYEAYGYRRTWKALLRAGEQVPRCQVQRLMAANGIRGAKRRGKPWRTTTPDPEAARRPDLVERDFTAERPNELWVADFSYLRCWEGVVFFSFVIDVYSRKVVGWQFASHMRTTLVLDALRMALSTRERVEKVRLIHHSDRGSQYLAGDYTQTLQDNDVLGSVGSTGDAYDNAMAESFVDSFKTELITDRVWTHEASSSSRSSSTSAASTTADYTKTSTTGHPQKSRNSTLRKPGQPSPHHEKEKLTTRSPSNPVRLNLLGSYS